MLKAEEGKGRPEKRMFGTFTRDLLGLEDANLKLASVVTDALGAYGRAMLKAIIVGEQDVGKLADLSRGLLRRKIPELQLALEGHVSQHHRSCCKNSRSLGIRGIQDGSAGTGDRRAAAPF